MRLQAIPHHNGIRDGAGSRTSATPRGRSDLLDRSAVELETEIIELSGRLSVGTYELLVLVGELDVLGTWAAWGSLSCAAWLADVCDIEISTARNQVRVARAMREHPALDAAMANGDVSYAKARVMVPYLTSENASELLAIAESTSAGRLGAAIAAWSATNDDEDDIRRRQHDSRTVVWRTDPDGMIIVSARLAPESGGKVMAVLDAMVMRSNAPAGASLAQQHADAFVEVVTESGGSVTAEVVVHVRPEGNALADGTPLSNHAVARMLPDAFVSLLMLDNQRRPIDASPRRRFPTRRQRRVLDEIDPECRQPGCHTTKFLQYDHKKPYGQGGPTTIDNLQRLCGTHNRSRNE